ncbi:MAG: OPT family oligopeptide transporter [Thermodesulfobacteriota bacterium]
MNHLTAEQIRTMTLEEKDKWWLEHIFRGDMPQLTVRSALTGMWLGLILSLTNLYVGMMTGWTLGVGITSVILAYSLFKVLSRIGLGSEITLLENNAMQSVATAAGYMTGPLVSSIPAYMLATGHIIPMYQTLTWLIVLAILGVLVAFPLKKRFINQEQMPFPEGRAAGVVMDDLHNGGGREAVFKSRLLAISAGCSACIEALSDQAFMAYLGLKTLALPDYVDDFLYKYFVPKICDTPLRDLTVSIETSIVMVAAGGLMGIKTGLSLFVGACLNYLVLAPVLIKEGIIQGCGFKNITMWALWGGVAMMTTASLYSFFSKPEVILGSFRTMIRRREAKKDVLADIELPMWVFVGGIPIVAVVTVALGHAFFGIGYFMGLIAIPLAFLFTLIAVTSTALTSITPTGALGKLTQLTFSAAAPGNITTNIMTAGITAEVASNASNLLMDIKPGYMLGGKPRHQAMGHVLGILAGAAASVPVFYVLLNGDLSVLASERFPMPSAQIWAAVAKVLTQGLSFLHPSAKCAILVGATLGIVLEMINQRAQGRFPLSGVGIGLAFVIPFHTCFGMFLGALFFWILKKALTEPRTKLYRIFAENQETLCAGAIAGGALSGIVLVLLGVVAFRGS